MKSTIKDKEALLRVAKVEKQSKDVLKSLETDLQSAKKQLADYRKSLIEKRDAGSIPDEFFKGDFLRKPNKGTLEFRPWMDDGDLELSAIDMYNTITGDSAEEAL